jgi:prophage antirepressor-like protein
MDQRTTSTLQGTFTVPGTRIMAPAPSGPGFAAPPPPPGNLQDVRRFDVPGEDAQLRVAMIDGEPWFVAADVATMLGYRMASDATRILKATERGTHRVRTPSGLQEVNIISEAGFYRLVMRSNRPEADAFQTWVTAEVLPQIRKTGAYTMQRELTRLELLEMALEAEKGKARLARHLDQANRAIAEQGRDLELKHRAVTEARELLGRAEEALTDAKPKVDAFEQLLNADGNYSLASAAQACGMGRAGFIQLCGELGLIIVRPGHSDHLRPYQDQIRTGRFAVKLRVFDVEKDGQTETRTEGTTVVTPKGVAFVQRHLQERRAVQEALRTAKSEDEAPTRQ